MGHRQCIEHMGPRDQISYPGRVNQISMLRSLVHCLSLIAGRILCTLQYFQSINYVDQQYQE